MSVRIRAKDWTTGVRLQEVAKSFSSPQRPNRIWGSPKLLFNGFRELFYCGQSGRGVKLTTYLQLLPRKRKVQLYLHSQMCLHDRVFNKRNHLTFLTYEIWRYRYHSHCYQNQSDNLDALRQPEKDGENKIWLLFVYFVFVLKQIKN
jgi:hypothetical protein